MGGFALVDASSGEFEIAPTKLRAREIEFLPALGEFVEPVDC